MKSNLLILSLLFCLNSLAQVPNNEAFSFSDIRTEIGSVPAVARVDLVVKNDSAANCTVGCNGYSEQMVWNTDIATTVSDFISAHEDDYGDVTLYQTAFDRFTITADVAGVDFAAATITTGIGTASNVIPNNPGGYANDLSAAFISATIVAFDNCYYPYYLVAGVHLASHNSQLNFRNYGGTPDGIPIPVATAATNILYGSFQSNWLSSVGGTGYYIDVSELNDFSTFVPNYENYYVGNFEGISVIGVSANTGYYYRVRAGTPNGTSGNSNTITLTTAAYTSNYHDWRLGTILELSAMRNLLYIYDIGNFQPGIYWSDQSGACTPPCHFAYHFVLNSSATNSNTSILYIRAVRSFISASWYNPGDTGQGGLVFNGTNNGDGTYTWYECTPVDLGKANWTDAQTICNNL